MLIKGDNEAGSLGGEGDGETGRFLQLPFIALTPCQVLCRAVYLRRFIQPLGQAREGGSAAVPISQMKKPRFRELR